MLQGQLIQLRPVRDADLDALYAAHLNIADRGPHFPLGGLRPRRLLRSLTAD